MRAPTIFMFGKSGQVARAMTERCAEKGIVLKALGREDADLMDPAALRLPISEAPDGAVVVNAAAYTAVDQAEEDQETAYAVNETAPGVMAQGCAARGLPFIHLSTDYVFNGAKDGAYVEDDATDPLGVYGASKLAGEKAVLAAGGRFVIIRTSWVYSPFGRNFVKTMLRVGAERDELRVVDDQIGAPTSAHDIADAILAAAGKLAAGVGETGIFHMTGAGEASWADFADTIFEKQAPRWGRRPVVTRILTADYPTPARRPLNSRLDCEKFERAFGYRPPDWRESLAKILDRLAGE